MKKNHIIILVVCAVLFMVGFIYFSKKSPLEATQKVVSDDGLAQLSISKTALPEGVSMQDVSIIKEPVENFFNAPEGTVTSPVMAYKLLPDGLALREPATITITAPRSQDAKGVFSVPVLWHKSKSGIDVVENTTVDMKDKTTMLVSGQIQHFSWIVTSNERYPIFTIKMEPYTVALPLGSSVPVKISITQNVYTHPSQTDGSNLLNVAPNTTWKVNMDGQEHTIRDVSELFQPNVIVLPPKELKQTDLVYLVEQRLTCKEKGQTTLIGRGGITLEYTIQGQDPYFRKNANGVLEAPAPYVLPKRVVHINDIFQSYLYDCNNPGIESAPSITIPSANVQICGLPGGPACPKH